MREFILSWTTLFYLLLLLWALACAAEIGMAFFRKVRGVLSRETGSITLMHFGKMILVAVAIGLIEAAWTRSSMGGPRDPTLGCFGIAIILIVVCWPRIWWLPGLGILEETTQVLVGHEWAWRPNASWVFHHWSERHFGVNLYPVIVLPLFTVLCEVVYWWAVRRRHTAATVKPADPAAT